MKKVLPSIFCLSLLATVINIKAQNALGSPEIGYIDYTTNPFSGLYYFTLFEDKMIPDHYLKNLDFDSLFEFSNAPYHVLPRYNVDQEIVPSYIVIKDKKDRNIIYYSVFESKDFLLICPNSISDVCNCGEDLSIYYPQTNDVKLIQRPFSFSVKENLVKLLQRKFEFPKSKDEFDNQCDVITILQTYYPR